MFELVGEGESTARIEAMSCRCWTRRIRARMVLPTTGRVNEVEVEEEVATEMVGLEDPEAGEAVVMWPASEA